MINEIEIKSKSEKSENDIKKRCQLFGVGNSKGKVFSELREFRKNLRKVSQIYGVNQKWLNSWRQEVEETVWLLFRGMLLEKLKESQDCLSPLMVNQEIDASLAGADGTGTGTETGTDKSLIQWYAPLKVNTVSSIYRYSESQYDFNPRSPRVYRKGYNPGKSVPKVYFSGLWLKKYGFEKGKKYAVYGFKNHLVLKRVGDSEIPDKIGERMVKDSSITIGRIKS